MKQSEIQPCAGCGKGVMHQNFMTFYVADLTYHIVDLPAVQRAHGLEMAMGAAAPLAQYMGPNEDMTKPMANHKMMVCLDCAMRKPLAELFEAAEEKTVEAAE